MRDPDVKIPAVVDPNPGEGAPLDFDQLKKAPVHTISIKSWPCLQAIEEKLGQLGLLGEQFLYCCIPIESRNAVHTNGHYLRNEFGPMIFGCHFVEVDGERKIAQHDSEREYDLWDYVNQNGTQTTAIIAIYDRTMMKHGCRAEFEFSDSSHPERALKAIVVVKGLDGK